MCWLQLCSLCSRAQGVSWLRWGVHLAPWELGCLLGAVAHLGGLLGEVLCEALSMGRSVKLR